MLVPLGPTTVSQAVNQIKAQSMQPMPMVAPPSASHENMIWVPDRVVLAPGQSGITVPAHWERLTPDGYLYVPPLTAPQPATGALQSFPSGYFLPTDERPYGP